MRKTQPKSYEYIEKLITKESDMMFQARKNSEQLGLDGISISATEAHIINYHLKKIKPKKVLEIGTLTGLSALHILETMPEDAILFTLEKSQQHAQLAKVVLQSQIDAGRCQIIIGDAKESLRLSDLDQVFDAIFIDGNKAAYLDYYNWAVDHISLGGIIFVDNVFLAGAVWGDETKQKFNNKQIVAVQTLNQKAFEDDRFSSVLIPTEEGLLISEKIKN